MNAVALATLVAFTFCGVLAVTHGHDENNRRRSFRATLRAAFVG
jgi:hypothetical protein